VTQENPSPASLSWVKLGEECLQLVINTQLYSPEVIFRTAYLFTGRCYLFLSSDSKGNILASFRLKQKSSDLEDVVGEFGNELINQRVRVELARETASIRELIVTQAFAEADFDDAASNTK